MHFGATGSRIAPPCVNWRRRKPRSTVCSRAPSSRVSRSRWPNGRGPTNPRPGNRRNRRSDGARRAGHQGHARYHFQSAEGSTVRSVPSRSGRRRPPSPVLLVNCGNRYFAQRTADFLVLSVSRGRILWADGPPRSRRGQARRWPAGPCWWACRARDRATPQAMPRTRSVGAYSLTLDTFRIKNSLRLRSHSAKIGMP